MMTMEEERELERERLAEADRVDDEARVARVRVLRVWFVLLFLDYF